MPEYDFRCDTCAHRFSVRFKTYAMVDSAATHCPQCESADLTRLIKHVAIPKAGRDYRGMSSQQMLSVLESGERDQVAEMVKQVTGDDSGDGAAVSRVDTSGSADAP